MTPPVRAAHTWFLRSLAAILSCLILLPAVITRVRTVSAVPVDAVTDGDAGVTHLAVREAVRGQRLLGAYSRHVVLP